MHSLALFAAGLAGSVAAQTSTLNLFIDNMDPNAQWGASVIGACSDSTTYEIVCTSAPLNGACSAGAAVSRAPKLACSEKKVANLHQAMTITEGPSVYIATTPAIVSETSATVTESCSLDPAASSAACVQTIVANGYGQNVATTSSFNLTGQYYYQYAVAATAGVKKLDASGTCDASSSKSGATGIGLRDTLTLGAVLLAGLAVIMVL